LIVKQKCFFERRAESPIAMETVTILKKRASREILA
jgi:hypothetical protein